MPNLQFPTIVAQKTQPIFLRDHGILDEGSYFTATNPTPGTGIATTTSITAETQVSPVMLIQNQWGVNDPNAKNIYLMGLNLIVTAAPTSATFWQGSLRMDLANPLKYTSGGSVITPVGCNGSASAASKAQIYFGAIVALAQAASGRLVANFMANPLIPLVKDEIRLEFGTGVQTTLSATAAANTVRSIQLPAIAIPPQGWIALQMWGGSNAGAPAFEFQLDYIER